MKVFFKNPFMLILLVTLFLSACKSSSQGDGVSIVDSTEGNLNSADGLILDFDEVAISTTYKKTISFYNKGSLTISDFVIDATALKDTPFSIVKNNCPSTIDTFTHCSVDFSFNSTEVDIFDAEVKLTYLSGIEQREKSLSLHAIAGTSATLEFDVDNSSPFEQSLIEPNSTRQLEYRIKNIGGLSAKNISWDVLNSPFSVTGGTCTQKLLPQASCTLSVLYAPTSETVAATPPDLPTEVSTPFKINYFNAIRSTSLDNTIIGQVDWIEGRLRFYPITSHKYFDHVITSSTPYTYIVTNYGTARATGLNFIIPDNFSLLSHTCQNGLDPNTNCSATIAFVPATVGDIAAEVGINFQSGRGTKNSLTKLSLTGKGLSKATFTFDNLIDPNFGTIAVGDDKTQTFTITNSGQFNATNLSVTINGDAVIVNNPCYALMIPNSNCSIDVKFAPQAVGARSADLVLTYFDGVSAVTQTYTLVAAGIASAVLRQTVPAAFGNVIVNGTRSLKVLFKNIGIVPATSMSFGALDAPFSYDGGSFPGTVSSGTEQACSDTLGPSEVCQVNYLFSPTENKDYAFNGTIDYFDQNFNAQITPEISLTGHGAREANLVFTDEALNVFTPPLSYGTVLAPGSTNLATINIKNAGEMRATNISAEFLTDTLHQNFAFASADSSVLFPGIDRSGNAASACTSLAPGGTCSVYIWFNPQAIGSFTDKLVVNYNNYNVDTQAELDINGIGAAIGIMNANGVDSSTNNLSLNPAASGGGFSITTLTLTNTGNGNATFTDFSVNIIDTTISRNTCAVVAAGTTCEVDFKFAPTTEGLKVGDVKFTYNDGTKLVVLPLNISAMAYLPIQVAITPSSGTPLTYNFDLVEVGGSKTQSFSLLNVSGGLSISSLSLSSPSAPFSLVNTDCVAPLGPGQICHIDLNFSPTVTGTFSGSLVVTFNNGVSANTKYTLALKGQGETPTSIHNGWSKIYAIGDKDVLNKPTVSEKKITIGWFAMTPKSGTITKYNIYRATTSNGYNFAAAPYAATTNASVREYTDTGISSGVTYYYTVRPVVTGFSSASRTTEIFSELMVVAPPKNMAFLHRWAVNREICQRLGFTLDSSQDFSCNYIGPGNKGQRFDIGYHMLVDRFELGANYKSISGQKPANNLTQSSAQTACATQNFTLTGRTATFVKRILSRKEFAAASLWASTMTNADIVTAESGTATTVNCNGSSVSTEITGSNTNCVSIFGLENMAGNEWEWVSDRVLNGVGVSDDSLRVELTNTDLDNIDLGFTQTGTMFSQECFSIPMALPFTKDAGVCQGTRSSTSLGESYFHGNLHFSPGTSGLKGPIAGGSSYNAGTSGIFTTYWTSVNNYFGTRCAVAVP